MGQLYRDEDRENSEMIEVEEGTSILRSEVEQAIKKMKWKKAEGGDGVVVEMLEALGEFAISKITDITNKIYRTGVIPERMKESEFTVIPKKAGAIDCSKHRTISIMSQIAKNSTKSYWGKIEEESE